MNLVLGSAVETVTGSYVTWQHPDHPGITQLRFYRDGVEGSLLTVCLTFALDRSLATYRVRRSA